MCSFQSDFIVASWCANYSLLCSLMGGFCGVFSSLLFEYNIFVMPILFFICHEESYPLQIHATVWKRHVVYFLRKKQGQQLIPKTSLKNSFKSPLCSCEHSANKWGRALLPQCQTHLVSVLPALPYVHMEKHELCGWFYCSFTNNDSLVLGNFMLLLVLCCVGNFCRL